MRISAARLTVYSVRRSMSTGLEKLNKTALYDLHKDLGGKMVPFAGYELPVQYKNGVLKEHLHTRAAGAASLFDVGHMGQIIWTGKDAAKFLETIVVGDIASLKPGEAKLSLIMNEQGGIVDDTVITNAGDHIYMVVNGACKYKDMDHFRKYLAESKTLDVHMQYLETQQLVALQGKGAQNVLSKLLDHSNSLDLSKLHFMSGVNQVTLAGISNCRVTRCGYTGEDGFEISVDETNAAKLTSAILSHTEVQVAGLGARDSLRLEAGLCLYGNDIDEKINPVEANLVWTIGGPKSRRRTEQGFLGAAHFLEPGGKLKAVTKKRVGFAGMRAPARAHTEAFDKEGKTKIGEVTSGGFGPSLNKPIAIGYVSSEFSAEGSEVKLMVRGNAVDAVVTKMPFMPTSYFRAQ